MPPRPARFSKSTKAAKPVVPAAADTTNILEDVASPSAAQEQAPLQQQEQHKRSRTCSVEVIITPTKKRRVVHPGRDHVDAPNVMVTPTKSNSRAASSYNFLPTPPVTPTISISEHDDEAEEDDAASICLGAPSTSSSTNSSRQETSPSPTPTPSSSYNANIYARARSLLRLSAHGESSQASSSSSSNCRLVGRQAEREQLDAFLRCNFPNLYHDSEATSADDTSVQAAPSLKKAKKAMYISGSPGTGKTALLQDILQDMTRRSASNASMRLSLLNCTTIRRPDDVWTRLAEELDLALPIAYTSAKGKSKARWTCESFREALTGSQTLKSLVVLDEIDHLLPDTPTSSSLTSASLSSNINVLSVLFAIALDPSSNLVLIGIANALDLTQRYSSLLFGSPTDVEEDEVNGEDIEDVQNGPELLHFRPFQSEEMVAIVKQRLNILHDYTPSTSDSKQQGTGEQGTAETSATLPLPIMMPAALELAAKKVAAVTGDLRSFLSLIRKAVEIFENEQRKRLLDMQHNSSGSKTSGPVSPTKNMLAYRNRKRKLSASQEGVDGEDDDGIEKKQMEDPLLTFDAKTAPKLTPSHILKATRVVSLVSSSSANSRSSSSNGNGINSSTGSLSTSTSSSNNLLQSKISELNLHQRLALTTFLILLARRISSKVPTWSMIGFSAENNNKDTPIDIDAEASSIPNGGAKPSELHLLYKTLLEKEDLLHPVSSSEFSDLLSGLHTRGLVGLEKEMFRFTSNTSTATTSTLAPPMMRRSSSSSSISSSGMGSSGSGGRSSRSPSPNSKNTSGAQAPLYLLYPFTSLQAVLSPPAPSSTTIPAKATATEASSLCSNLLTRESKRLKRIQKQNEQLEIQRKENELAPRAGFNGDGLDDEPRHTSRRASYVGEKDKRGRGVRGEVNDDEDDEMEEDHEKRAKLQEEDDEKKENHATPSDW